MLRPTHQFRSHGIALDVAQHGHQVIVILQRKRLETPLPHMARTVVVAIVSLGMSRQEPLDPPSEVGIAVRPEHQVKVVWHQTIAKKIHLKSLLSFDHPIDESIVVRGLVKHRLAAIPAIQSVVDHPSD